MWVGPEILPEDGEARLFLSQYLTKCPVMLSRISIERRDGHDVVQYSSDRGVKDFTPLDFLAALSAHVPDVYEQTIRFYGAYSPRSRGKRRKESAADQLSPTPLSTLEPIPKRAASRSWARLIKKIYEVDPLICPKCGGQMKIKAFVTDPKEVSRLMQSLMIPNFHPPPPLVRAEKAEAAYWEAI